MTTAALRVLTWPDYAIRGVERLFRSATGLTVDWNFFDQNEEAFARVRAAPDHFDVILADGLWPARYMQSGLIAPLDPTGIEGWSHLIPTVARWCAKSWASGPGTVMAFPCYWGLRGIIYDPGLVSPPGSWQALSSAPPRSLWLNSQGSEVIAELALGMGIRPERVYNLTDAELVEVGSRSSRRCCRPWEVSGAYCLNWCLRSREVQPWQKSTQRRSLIMSCGPQVGAWR